jgi:hypothetical protein
LVGERQARMIQKLFEQIFKPKLKFEPDELPEILGFQDRENRTKHWAIREDLQEVIEVE